MKKQPWEHWTPEQIEQELAVWPKDLTMNISQVAEKITDALWNEAAKKYPMVETMTSAAKRKEIRKEIYDTIFRELTLYVPIKETE